MSYSSDSAADRLAAVRTAINKCLTSQSYSIAGRNQQMANLRDLRAMEKELQDEASNGSGSMCSLGIQERPSR